MEKSCLESLLKEPEMNHLQVFLFHKTPRRRAAWQEYSNSERTSWFNLSFNGISLSGWEFKGMGLGSTEWNEKSGKWFQPFFHRDPLTEEFSTASKYQWIV